MRTVDAPNVERQEAAPAANVAVPAPQPPRATPDGYPVGGRRFDWIVVILSGWLVGGVHLDGWAHNHFPQLETFFTPWHAALYTGFFALFLTLLFWFARNLGRGYSWQRSLPRGYALSLLGGCIFLVGGGLDLLWHLAFGIEANTEALLSPTHLILATGGILLISGPLRAAWQRPESGRLTLAAILPALLSLTFVLALLTFFTQFAHPQVGTLAAERVNRPPVRSDLSVMGRDGTAQTRLTLSPEQQNTNAVWSPDGTRIALDAGTVRNRQLFVMNADGTGRTQLTDGTGLNVTPSWSPDGRKVAFSSTRDGNGGIFVMNADGSAPIRLTTRAKGNDLFPVWSPDGTRIAFHSDRDGRWAIYVMNANGTGETPLATSGGDNFSPAWSPDGTRIAFCSTRDGHHNIYVMQADGSGQTPITTGTVDNWQPSWSPDGKTIAFFSDRARNDDVFLMNADGSGQMNLTRSLGTNATGRISWSPDGNRLLYAVQDASGGAVWQGVNLGVASILLQTVLLMAAVLFLIRRWPMLPFGSLTIVFAIASLLVSFMQDRQVFIPAAILAGLLADLLLQWLRPAVARSHRFHLFAFAVPVVYYALYFATLALTAGIGWTIHLWLGAIFMAGIAGLLLSYLLVPGVRIAEERP